jgi:surfeit locus 1 family protein
MLFFKNHRFSPRWYFVVATIVLCALFVQLGCWQLRRAALKEHLQQVFAARLHLAPISLNQLPRNSDILYYPVTATGHYDNAHTVLLDNKIYAHRVGYEVLTPLVEKNHQPAVLVNRGWIPAPVDRRVLPVIPAVMGEHTIVGNVYLILGKPFTLGDRVEPNDGWPRRVQALDISLLQNILKQPLYPFVVLLSPEAQAGFVRDWQPVQSMPPSRHIGYAVQWFAFAAVLLIIFFVLNLRKR